jgi:hypothetical protein
MGGTPKGRTDGLRPASFFSACTDAESLEQSRARSFKIAERVFPSVHPSAGGF